MRDFENFKELRRKYFAKTATPEEEAEFIKLYNSGKFADVDEEAHRELWNSRVLLSDEDRAAGEEIHAKLLAKHFHSRQKSGTRQLVWISAAASLLLFISIGIWKYQALNTPTTTIASNDMLFTVDGPAYVRLPDTSIVELKLGSKLTYNKATFGTENRRLGLQGTAFFDVTHNKDLPFQVFSGKVITTVLGTSFNVSDTAGFIEVTVVRGKVRVGNKDSTFHVINPNEKIVVSTRSMTYATTKVNAISEIAWTERHLILDGLTMDQAIQKVEQHFKASITIENEQLKSCPVTAYFVNDESLTQVLDVLCKVKRATYVINQSRITIQNGVGCNK